MPTLPNKLKDDVAWHKGYATVLHADIYGYVCVYLLCRSLKAEDTENERDYAPALYAYTDTCVCVCVYTYRVGKC